MKIEAYYRPHRSSARIAEIEGPPLRELGGTFWVFLHNPSRTPFVVSAIRLNGTPVEALTNGRGLNWFRLTPEPIPPRGVSLLILNAQRALLRQAPLTLEIFQREGAIHKAILPTDTSPLTLSYACTEGRTLTVWVRNDDPQRDWQIERLCVAGREVRFTTPQRTLAPSELTFLKARLPFQPEPHATLPLQLYGRSGEATTLTGGVVRPMNRHFPTGTWMTELWDAPDRMREWRERGFDTFVYSAENALTEREQQAFTETCPRLGVKALVFAGYPRPATAFIERHKANYHIAAYMIKDEPDWDDPNKHGMHIPTLCERIAQVFRDREVQVPLYLNLARSRRFGEFATIPDIACYDAYRVGAPMPDLSPDPWGNLLELAATYTEDLRANCEPLPFWVWAQGAHTWDERVWVNNQLGRACPTPEEIRVQLWLQLSRGAKGVLWFIGFDEARFRDYYMRSDALPQENRAQLVETLVQHGREAFEEQTRLNRFLEPLKPTILQTEWRPNAVRILRATRPERLDASLLIGERVALLWLTNLDYTRHPQGYRFATQRGIELEVSLPRWLKPKAAKLLAPQAGETPLKFALTGGKAILQIESLPEQVGLVWLQA